MNVAWGLVVLLLSSLCWLGQVVSSIAPDLAVRLGLQEADDAVEPVYAADGRGEAAWDALTLWTMAVAGLLLVLDEPAWAYLGLVGGGTYAYFAGRGILTRMTMLRRGFEVGTDANVRRAFAFLTIWGVMALITIVVAVADLRGA